LEVYEDINKTAFIDANELALINPNQIKTVKAKIFSLSYRLRRIVMPLLEMPVEIKIGAVVLDESVNGISH
jgi:hypothetical protein